MSRTALSLTAVFCALLSVPTNAAVIVNGSFETPIVPVGGFTNYPSSNPTAITGWTIVGVDSAIVNKSFAQNGITFQAQAGNQWIDLAGERSNSMASGVRQSVDTIVGHTYQVTFYVGSAKDTAGAFDSSTIDLTIGAGSREHYNNPATPSNQLDWKQFNVSFLATSISTALTFQNGSAATNFLSALDNVSIADITDGAPVPEASSIAIWLVFGAVVGLKAKRRR